MLARGRQREERRRRNLEEPTGSFDPQAATGHMLMMILRFTEDFTDMKGHANQEGDTVSQAAATTGLIHVGRTEGTTVARLHSTVEQPARVPWSTRDLTEGQWVKVE